MGDDVGDDVTVPTDMTAPIDMPRDESSRPRRQRVRLRFGKDGDVRLISHRDLLTALDRLFRRAGVALSMTGGFHPRPRISFPLSLALGIRGLDEVFEVEFDDPPDAGRLLADLQAAAPAGLTFTSAELVPPAAPRLSVESAWYEIDVPEEQSTGVAERVAALIGATSHVVVREHRGQTVDVRAAIESLSFQPPVLRMRLSTDSATAAAKPQEVLTAIGLERLLDEGHALARTELVLAQS